MPIVSQTDHDDIVCLYRESRAPQPHGDSEVQQFVASRGGEANNQYVVGDDVAGDARISDITPPLIRDLFPWKGVLVL
ncbi:hypothetical protein [Aeromicrobium sp.]|uniref:hypothetical protein n=1 Tax=Aeromicrobium sp. TaxID=1871063 RepID=UPI001988C9CD|nr:hypothetical protein [Aeromicrobium sp.]MBC7631626.1 hypothetical protein [Aeromicrobium sp.]